MIQPTHLQTDNPIPIDFDVNEKVFKRFPIREKIPNVFLRIPTEQFINGFSLFRKKLSTYEDSLWRIYDEPNCSYQYKEKHEVFFCEIDYLKLVKEKYGIEAVCKHVPDVCNKAHCDILFFPSLSFDDPDLLMNIKLVLSSLFSYTGIKS